MNVYAEDACNAPTNLFDTGLINYDYTQNRLVEYAQIRRKICIFHYIM